MQTQACCSQLCNPVSTDEIPTTSSTWASSHGTLLLVCLACKWILMVAEMVRSDPPRAAVIVAADWWKLAGPECTHIVLWAPGLPDDAFTEPPWDQSRRYRQSMFVSHGCETVKLCEGEKTSRINIKYMNTCFFPDDSLFADFIRSFFPEYQVFCFQRFFCRGEGGVRWWERRRETETASWGGAEDWFLCLHSKWLTGSPSEFFRGCWQTEDQAKIKLKIL